jgi:CRP-like cAMP-binding protein
LFMQEEITAEKVVGFIGKVPGFSSLSSAEIEQMILPILSITTFRPGQIIIKQGDVANSVYFLYRGQAQVDIHFEKSEDVRFFIEEGAIFGEMALVSHEKRSATISAISEVICLTVDVETFQNLMRTYWRITQAIANLIGNRRIELLGSVLLYR